MKKKTSYEVSLFLLQQNCELLSEYLGNEKPLQFKCSCGREATTTWHNFRAGHRCGMCVKQSPKKKKSLDQVVEIFNKRGCIFLDNEYRGYHFKHSFRCHCGEVSKISLVGFERQGQSCKTCGIQKRSGENNYGWKPDREKHRLDQLFRKKCYKAVSASLKAVGKIKIGRTSDMIGYGPKQLQEHIQNHPDWDGVKNEDWSLDHIFPIQAFIDHGISDLKLINSLDNLRPMEFKANIRKSDTYDNKLFLDWLSSK